jgi:hypothetical protein
MLALTKQYSINTALFLKIFLFVFLVAGCGSGSEDSQHWNHDIQKIIDEGRTNYGIPGILVIIGFPG